MMRMRIRIPMMRLLMMMMMMMMMMVTRMMMMMMMMMADRSLRPSANGSLRPSGHLDHQRSLRPSHTLTTIGQLDHQVPQGIQAFRLGEGKIQENDQHCRENNQHSEATQGIQPFRLGGGEPSGHHTKGMVNTGRKMIKLRSPPSKFNPLGWRGGTIRAPYKGNGQHWEENVQHSKTTQKDSTL